MSDLDTRLTVFDATTALVPDPVHADRFHVVLDEAWQSLVGIHGGYQTAIAVKAAQFVAGDRPVRTITSTFLRPGVPGPAEALVERVRTGRSVSNLSVTLMQRGRPILVGQVVAAHAAESTSWEAAVDLGIAEFDRCIPLAPPEGVAHFDHAEAVLDPDHLPFTRGPIARVGGYMRPKEPRPIDAAWLGMALDWFPPASFTRVDPPVGGISISYTVHVHRTLGPLSDDEWLAGLFHVDVSHDGIALEKGVLADPRGRVIAESFHTRWTAGPNQLTD